MRITWYHDFNIRQYLGGAEITDWYWMQLLKDHTLTECISGDRMVGSDLTIIGNHNSIPSIPSNRYWVIMHGYHIPEFNQLYKGAEKIIYPSPQRQKDDGLPNSTCISPFVDGSIYRYRNKYRPKKRKGNLYIGRIHELKGLSNLITWANENQEHVDVYGYGDVTSLARLNTCELLHFKGIVDQRQVIDLMNEYKRFIFLPEEKESFCRTIVEAHLCEMEVITNRDKIGAYSWGWDFEDRDKLTNELYKQLEQFKNSIP